MTAPASFARRVAATTAIVAALPVLTANVTAAARAARPPSLPGHPLLIDRPGLHVYGPANIARSGCPQLLPLPAHAAAIVQRAVVLAMPPFEHRLHLDGRDPAVTVGPTAASGFSPLAGGCGRTDWARSIFASVQLPHVAGASLAQHRFAVGRVRQGWVIWAYIH